MHKTILISLPWADYRSPNHSIGELAAFAQRNGFDVEALHLHLEIAALFDLDNYEDISYGHPTAGEALIAALLFKKQRKRLLRFAEKHIPNVTKFASRLEQAFKKAYDNIDFSKYGLVGFTVNHQQLFPSLLFSEWIKRDHPNIKITLGGRCVAERMGESALHNFHQIDWCIDGEGELPLLALLKALNNKTINFKKVPGLMYRSPNGVIRNEGKQLQNLSNMPDPDYDHYFSLLSTHPLLKSQELLTMLPVLESRGCAYSCAFCADSQFWCGCRQRPPSEIANSIERLCNKYTSVQVYISSEMINPSAKALLFKELSSHRRDYVIAANVRAGLSKSLLHEMKLGGVRELQVGVEALNTSLLKKMNKGSTLITNLETMKFCEEIGIVNTYNLIIAFPTESQRDIDQTVDAIDYACSYAPPITLVEFSIRGSSPVYRQPDKFSIYDVEDVSDFARHLPKDVHRSIVLWYKLYKSNRKVRDYRKLKNKVKRWKQLYDESRRQGQRLLYYVDYRGFLYIYDFRTSTKSITLKGMERELYLFCDSIRNWREIQDRFSKYSTAVLKRMLDYCFEHKIMYRENENYLSLAIRESMGSCRSMPFL